MCLVSQSLAAALWKFSFHVFDVFSSGGYYFLAFITLTCTFYLKGPKMGLKGVLQTLRTKTCPVPDLALAVLFPSLHSGERSTPGVPQGPTNPGP